MPYGGILTCFGGIFGQQVGMQVEYGGIAVRITPAGRMERASSGTSQPSFTIRFRARVE